MSPERRNQGPREHGQGAFGTTCWSVVAAAAHPSDPDGRDALAALCQIYWAPLYEFARRRGYSAPDAADLTQGFFAVLIEKNVVDAADPERGRFRNFLLTAFKRFLLNEYDRSTARKRGGGKSLISISAADAESRLNIEPLEKDTPERLFERRWAITLLDRVLGLLENEFREKGRSALFERCRECLTGAGTDQQYASIAAECRMSEAAVRVAVHRMRVRYRELLRREVAQTVCSEADVADELRLLLRAVQN